MALGDPYVTRDEFKARVDISDNQDDLRIASAVIAGSRSVDKICGRQFNDAGAVSARVYRPDSAYLTTVDDFSTTTGLVVKTGANGSFDVVWTSADYELEPLNGVVDGETGWPFWRIRAVQQYFQGDRRASVQVTAQWGWSAIPYPVKEATFVAAEEIFKLRDAPFGVGGYADFGVIKIRENPFVVRNLMKYQRSLWLAR